MTLWQADVRDAELHLTKQTAGNGVVTLQEFDPNTGQLTKTLAGGGSVQDQSYTYDSLGKLVTRADANTALAESFEYDTLNRLTKSIVSLTPSPLVSTFSYNAIGTSPSSPTWAPTITPRQASRGRTASRRCRAAPSPPASPTTPKATWWLATALPSPTPPTTRPRASPAAPPPSASTPACAGAGHDPEHRRYAQSSPSGVTLYLSGMGVLAERFGQLGRPNGWTNFSGGTDGSQIT